MTLRKVDFTGGRTDVILIKHMSSSLRQCGWETLCSKYRKAALGGNGAFGTEAALRGSPWPWWEAYLGHAGPLVAAAVT